MVAAAPAQTEGGVAARHQAGAARAAGERAEVAQEEAVLQAASRAVDVQGVVWRSLVLKLSDHRGGPNVRQRQGEAPRGQGCV